jgi:hypothetical protein
MRKLVLSLVAGAAMIVGSAASATSFIGSTGGCFGIACTPTATATLTGTGLSFASGTFNVQDSNGFAGIGNGLGNPNTLGSFTLLPTPGTTNFNDPFTLLVSFTAPAGAGTGTYFATVVGSVTDSTAGGIEVAFNSPSTLWYNTADGGSFSLTVNNVAVSNDGVLTPITGYIRAVPEPATWAMMLVGFAGIGFAMRRRRQPAMAQVA